MITSFLSLSPSSHLSSVSVCISPFLSTRLFRQQECLEGQITGEESAIKEKEEKLEGLHPALDTLQKATLPLQEMLGLPLDKVREEENMALLLPV